MLFNSYQFLIFFPVVTSCYFLLPHRSRWLMLLLASCLFYMAFIPTYIVILALLIVIDYNAGIWIERTEGPVRRTFLVMSILATCVVLFVFKYFNFFIDNITAVCDSLHWTCHKPALRLVLPIGLSFHTFQSLSYVIEVYRKHQKAERNFGIYALYVMFYPQLVAGPIERPQNLLHQFYEEHHFAGKRVLDGLRLMAWGLYKKVLVADTAALIANAVFAKNSFGSGWEVLLGMYAFSFQIYADFSGYSDIARGAARVMGFELMLNFRLPYFATGPSDLWRRWHISLSSWLRDYLYISLGGNRQGRWRTYRNLLLTMVIGGLWHGAAWTYVIWGAYHGLLLAGERFMRELFPGLTKIPASPWAARLLRAVKILVMFHLTSLGWLFFRAVSMRQATEMLKALAGPWPINWPVVYSYKELLLFIWLLAVVQIVQFVRRDLDWVVTVTPRIKVAFAAIVCAQIMVVWSMIGTQPPAPFIYFQF